MIRLLLLLLVLANLIAFLAWQGVLDAWGPGGMSAPVGAQVAPERLKVIAPAGTGPAGSAGNAAAAGAPAAAVAGTPAVPGAATAAGGTAPAAPLARAASPRRNRRYAPTRRYRRRLHPGRASEGRG